MKTTPLDVLKPSTPRATSEQAKERMDICGNCDRLKLGVCGECHCVMRIKTTLAKAECPLGKWGEV
jgi:hypothetical protein